VCAKTVTEERVAPEGGCPRILTPDQRLRVFVSSTLEELAAERAAASESIAGLNMTPVLFELGARPHPPQPLYRAYLEQSQLFVGVYWQSYGWVAPGESVSGIEDEYRLSDGLPRLLYVKEPAPEREPRLREFLERLRAEGSASYKRFSTAAELRELLARDLALVLTERFQAAAEAPPSPPTSLPAPRTSFVGRDRELAQIEDLLQTGSRLLTLVGPGGIGKTRLATEAAQRVADRYSDGVVFVPLDGVENAERVPAAIAEALGVRELGGDAVAALVGHLRRRRLLLVLDNFEHVISSAHVVATLLDSASGLSILVTSRELLRLSGEHELEVPPLTPEQEAIVLFSERAAAARHAFELAPEDVPLVAEICRRLDGVPLAIELAAPRMRLLTPAQLLERLGRRLALQGPRDAPVRQRTLEAAIAWSYELLAEEERLLSFGTAPLEGEERAQAHLREVLAAFESADDLWGIGTTLHAMARLRVVFNHYDGARDLFERAVTAVELVGDDLGIALASGDLAMAKLAAGDVTAARAVMDRLLEHRHSTGIAYAGDDTLDILARVEHAEGEHERAIALLAAAEVLRERLHTPLWPLALERQERLLAELREIVGDAAFEAAYTRGATVDADDVQEIVLRLGS
jgi:hypothetical protein